MNQNLDASSEFTALLDSIKVPQMRFFHLETDMFNNPCLPKGAFESTDHLLSRDDLYGSELVQDLRYLFKLSPEQAVTKLDLFIDCLERNLETEDPNARHFYGELAIAVLAKQIGRCGQPVVDFLLGKLDIKHQSVIPDIVKVLDTAKVYDDQTVQKIVDSYLNYLENKDAKISLNGFTLFIRHAGLAAVKYLPHLLQAANYCIIGYSDQLGFALCNNWSDLEDSLEEIIKLDTQQACSFIKGAIQSPYDNEKIMALRLISIIPDLDSSLMIAVAKLFDHDSNLVVNEAMTAIGSFGREASSYTSKLIEISRQFSAFDQTYITLAKIAEPRDMIREYLFERWEDLKELEDDPKYTCLNEGEAEDHNDHSQASFARWEVFTGGAEFETSSGPNLKLELQSIVEAIGMLAALDDQAMELFLRISKHSSVLIRSRVEILACNVEDINRYKAIYPILLARDPIPKYVVEHLLKNVEQGGPEIIKAYEDNLKNRIAVAELEDQERLANHLQGLRSCIEYTGGE